MEVAPTGNPHHQGLDESNKTKIAKMVNCQNVHMHVTIHLVEVIIVAAAKVVVIFVELYLSSFRLHLSSQALVNQPVCLCSRPYLKYNFSLHLFC